ncbi:hypothetical protein HOE37_02420 [Candidatus Woesearchaeota archaeon]|jgi:hypothetical protein|nr:hypothetical protein [Candidatus Woesearchaeota archaeon]MBT4110688.1 hypothetical protein [Candidatus Woesearchaeota archaeon]MBT4336284.1 hypothetical protein [Candidatus Woesearchaeota archaeon]MBT4469355.1 hypothetical protein [Candidatus Woesearchaeota archaeon]MBT6743822.1 hypothetical protein [Candidatus Woesearchaeota archaeon]
MELETDLEIEYGRLFKEHLKETGQFKVRVCRALSEVLPYSASTISSYLDAYADGAVFYPYAVRGHLTFEEKRERRSQIFYALGVKEDSELIAVLRKLDPEAEYPPTEKPEQISPKKMGDKEGLY